jgi:hypothetical protein
VKNFGWRSWSISISRSKTVLDTATITKETADQIKENGLQ